MKAKNKEVETLTEKAKKFILKYYREEDQAFGILWEHSLAVMHACLRITQAHPKLEIDKNQVILGALLHDIGIRYTDAPDLGCFGSEKYLAHGYLGSKLLSSDPEFKSVALFCERHTGVGITQEQILKNKLPLPLKDYIPISIEEKLVCFADKFYSKSSKNLSEPKAFDSVLRSQNKYGKYNIDRFKEFIMIFGTEAIYTE